MQKADKNIDFENKYKIDMKAIDSYKINNIKKRLKGSTGDHEDRKDPP